MHELIRKQPGRFGQNPDGAEAAEVPGNESGCPCAPDIHREPTLMPRRLMQLRSKSSCLRLRPTNGLSDQSSDAETHRDDQSNDWRSHEQRASNVDLEATDRNPSPQLVDCDRERPPAYESPATDCVGDRRSYTRKPSTQHCWHNGQDDDRNDDPTDRVEYREPLVQLHQAKPISESKQPSNRDPGDGHHHEFDSLPSFAKVAHASRVGGVDREPAFRTTARDRISQRLQATAAAEMHGVHITRAV